MTNAISLLKPKLVERIHIHDGDLTAFYEEFPQKYLPAELGGTCEYDNKLWICELLEPEQNEHDTKYQTSAHIQSLSYRQAQNQRPQTYNNPLYWSRTYDYAWVG